MPEGATLASVGDALKEAGYIRSQTVFASLVTLLGGERSIASGDYLFKKREGAIGLALQIARGDHGIDVVKVTVPEGRNVREIAAIYAEKIPGFDTDAFKTLALPREGYLFPETYFLYETATPQSVVERMERMFAQQTDQLFTAGIPAGRTKADIVTMASLVEREAHGTDDRAMIAGILWNRLSRGMRLQVDATAAYAAAVPESELTTAMLQSSSPYNTYRHGGLPPGPIGNPGRASLEAALHPAETPYLYYLHDGRGSIHYAKTYAEHQKNVAKYLK